MSKEKRNEEGKGFSRTVHSSAEAYGYLSLDLIKIQMLLASILVAVSRNKTNLSAYECAVEASTFLKWMDESINATIVTRMEEDE